MYVRYRFRFEIYRFRHSLHTCLACYAHDDIVMEVVSRLRTRRIEVNARTSPEI